MFETSKDLLFIIIAFCILWLTFFLCWALYYLVKILGGLKKKSDKIDDILKTIKSKIERSTAFFSLVAEGIKYLVGFMKDKKKEGKEEGKKKKIVL